MGGEGSNTRERDHEEKRAMEGRLGRRYEWKREEMM